MIIRKFALIHEQARQAVIDFVMSAELIGWVVEIKELKRTLDQNGKFHSLCGDLEKSPLGWAGKRRKLHEWKVLLVSGHAIATQAEQELVAGLEGELVNIRESTAQMGVKRASSLIEYTVAFCALNDVKMTEKKDYERY